MRSVTLAVAALLGSASAALKLREFAIQDSYLETGESTVVRVLEKPSDEVANGDANDDAELEDVHENHVVDDFGFHSAGYSYLGTN